MYRIVDGKVVITVDDWGQAGLSYRQFRYDSKNGVLDIHKRGYKGNTLIDVTSIKRPDRLQKIEEAFGRVADAHKAAQAFVGTKMAVQPLMVVPEELDVASRGIFKFKVDTEARAFYLDFRKPDGTPLDPERIEEYVNRASILNGCMEAWEAHRAARARAGKRAVKSDFYKTAMEWFRYVSEQHYQAGKMSSERAFEKVYKRYVEEGYKSLIHAGIGNDSARKVSTSLEKLLLALWSTHDKPFIKRVHELYNEFTAGKEEIYDKETGLTFRPEDFWVDGKPLPITERTIWNYLKDVVNYLSVYARRNGNFDYANSMRLKHHRKLGKYSLSKVSMDDVTLSRKSKNGWVNKYIAVDVVSGYYFEPVYVLGRPTEKTVMDTFRNMFCELIKLGMPIPGEIEVEHHLMQHIEWLNKVFPFVRFCASPTEKRAEHNIRALKYGAAKDAGHTRGRWHSKSEAYKSVRTKVDGDFVEPVYHPAEIIADDLKDIETHNNELHPNQKRFPGLTRKDIFMGNVNPDLKPIEEWYLFRYIGNETETTILKNDYVQVNKLYYELEFHPDLKKLAPNNYGVTAYWLAKTERFYSDEVYLWQNGTYIGKALRCKTYNECAIERTDEDEEIMQHQFRRAAKFDKFVREQQAEIPKIGHQHAEIAQKIMAAPVEIVPPVQEEEEEDIFEMKISYGEDLKKKARDMM